MNWSLPANKNFPLVGGNWGNQRYSTLDQINRSNVKKLGGVWMMHLEEGKTAGNIQTTPFAAVQPFQKSGAQICRNHPGAFGQKQRGCGAADALARRGYEDGFPCRSVRHVSPQNPSRMSGTMRQSCRYS